MIKLSKRLLEIASLVSGKRIVDIGCDHGLLDIYLVKRDKDIKVIASDLSLNALESAKRNIKKYGVDARITTVLSNGLENIDTKDVDTIIISGMGAHSIVGILYQGISKLKKVDSLILQSNNDLDFLRSKIVKLGYYIEDERLVEDGGIIYTVIVFKKGYRFYTKRSLYLGPKLSKEKSLLYIKKCRKDLKKLESFYDRIPRRCVHHKVVTYWKIKILMRTLL